MRSKILKARSSDALMEQFLKFREIFGTNFDFYSKGFKRKPGKFFGDTFV